MYLHPAPKNWTVFWHLGREGMVAFKPRIVQDVKYGLRVQTFVEMHPDFEVSSGEFVDCPWLQLRALPPDHEHLGLGAMKCRALCSLKAEMIDWLKRQRNGPDDFVFCKVDGKR